MAEKQTNKDRMREIVDSIENGIKELFESDKYRQYLSTMSRFHRYSVNNTMLIYMQRPDATHVAGFNKWRDQFGRNVKKGEKGIKIIAPTPYKKKIEEIKRDPDTKAPLLDADGNAIMEEKEIKIPMYKPVAVFDVSQTEGKPLPQLAADLSGNVQQYEIFMEALRRASPVPMEIKPVARDILAITVCQADWDRRYSPDNRAWANAMSIPANPDAWGTDRNCYLAVNSHPGLVDLFLSQTRKAYAQERQKASVRDKLKKPPETTSPKISAKSKAPER